MRPKVAAIFISNIKCRRFTPKQDMAPKRARLAPPQNRRVIPAYNVQIEMGGGLPHVIIVRPLLPLGRAAFDELRVASLLAAQIRASTRDALRAARINPRRVSGYLQAYNLNAGGNNTFDEIVHLQDLNGNQIMDVIAKLQQSSEDIFIFDLEWRFTIDPNSITVGGARKVHLPSFKVATPMESTWQHHTTTLEGGEVAHIGCAAFALTILMNPPFKKDTPLKAGKMAWKLQKELGWEEEISLAQLQTFIEKYPTKKLVVLIPNAKAKLKTLVGKGYVAARAKEDSLYLIYDASQSHFGGTKTPLSFFNTRGAHKWCYNCDERFLPTTGHECEALVMEKKSRRETACPKCGVFGKHDCELISCRYCSEIYKKAVDKEFTVHRCILMKEPRLPKRLLLAGEDGADKHAYACLVWDIESMFELVETIHRHPDEFEVGEDGKFTGQAVTYSMNQSKHKPIAASFMDIITGYKQVFYGEECLENFVAAVLSYNKGCNILFAHNSSGYDTRMVFDTLAKTMGMDVTPIMRGSKFIQLKAKGGKIVFRDSMLHMPGSLRNLGKSFGLVETKGFFPYLFCTTDNVAAAYRGDIPDKKYFDLPSSCRSPQDRAAFEEWYATWQGREWDLKEELLLYLDMDIVVLAKVMKAYHTEAMTLNGISPIFNATGPSYVHEVIVSELVTELELPDPKEEMEEYSRQIQQFAEKDFWGVQTPSEYWFARKALRGGKTDTRCIYRKLSEHEIREGKQIWYQDEVSMYPRQQVKYDYPTGLPTIHVWDIAFYPCFTHQNSRTAKCGCTDKYGDKRCNIKDWIGSDEPTGDFIQSDPEKHFGIWCITWECPKNLFHPVLVSYNADSLKCIASLDDKDYIEHCSTSPEVIRALECGYKIKRVHRFDAYKKSAPLWGDIMWRFYLRKMIYSRNQPDEDEFNKLVDDYEQEYGQVVGDMIRDTKGKWEKNAAKKTICKRDANCGWGKQCQEPNQGQNLVASFKNDKPEILDLFQNLSAGAFKWGGCTMLAEDKFIYRYEYDSKAMPDLHNFYLPAGLFVPAYGRLELLTQLNLLGDRVLYHDTDSIIYINDPKLYNIPQGNILGAWEREDIDAKHGGIVEFVGMAPKTYALKAADGTTLVKAKGISLSTATSNIVSFESMKTQVVEFMETGAVEPIMVPTMNFNYRLGGEGISTHKSFKALKFNPNDLKGELRGAVLFPFGHE